MYERTYGPKYNDLGEYPSAAKIAAAVRADIKAADAAGELAPYPEGVKFKVRSETFAGGCAVNVYVDVRALLGWTPDHWGTTSEWVWTEIPEDLRRYPSENRRISDELRALASKLAEIRSAYNHDGSEVQVDYFDVRYYGSVFLGDGPGGLGGLVLG
jgi:hypothetical protein